MSTLPKITAAAFAKLLDAQVGKPYVLGAEASISDPNPKAFDCSELVQWAFGRSGNKITDLAAAQYDATRPVTGTPKVGDLVFLRNNPARSNGIGHVAILTKKLAGGDWRIVEARGHAYGVVRTTLSYWKGRAHYAGIRRLPSFSLLPDPAGTPKPVSYPPTLREGSSGKWVKALQKTLNAKGAKPKLKVDADFKNKTGDAVEAYQRKHKLTVDRVVGRQAWRSLGITL